MVTMNNRIVMMFAIFIVIYVVVHVVSQSAVFSRYPEAINTASVSPPIVLQNPGVSGVSVSLGVAGVSANVTVLLPYSLVISQDAIYYTTFDSGVPTDWAGSACWGESSTAWVGGSITCDAPAAYQVAYYNSPIVSNTLTFYVGAYVRSNNLGANRYAGITLYDRSTGNYYIAAIGNNRQLNILRCVGGCPPNPNATTGNLGLSTNTWYFLVAYWTPDTLTAYLYRTDNGALIGSISYSDDSPISFNTVGVVAYSAQGWVDELVVAYNDPEAVYVDNVPSNWVVRIYNGTVLVNQATSAGARVSIATFYGTANGHNSTILRSGRIEVYDNLGNLRVSRSEVIVTGRVYYLQPQGFDNRVLNVVNVDLKDYYGLLSLRSPASYSGFSTLRLYLCNPSGCSTALDIIAGSSSTSEITLPASQTSYIRLVATPSASGASANIQIWLNYSTKPAQNAAIVKYPINIVIR
jgi:hypothetical protein